MNSNGSMGTNARKDRKCSKDRSKKRTAMTERGGLKKAFQAYKEGPQ